MDSLARVLFCFFRHRIALPTLTHRREKRQKERARKENDKDKKKEKNVEKNNSNILLECLSLKKCAIHFSHKSSSSSGNAAF